MAYCAIIGVLPRCITELIVSFLVNIDQEAKKKNWAKYWMKDCLNQVKNIPEACERIRWELLGRSFVSYRPPSIREIVDETNRRLIAAMKPARERFFYTIFLALCSRRLG